MKENVYIQKRQVVIAVISILLLIFIIHVLGKIGVAEQQEKGSINTVKIDSGIEVRTDIDGDGKNERVVVQDVVSGDYAFTQLQANFLNGDKVFIDYPGYHSSFLIAGELNGDRAADIILVRYDTGSNFGGCGVSVLRYGKEGWEEYPNVILNMEKAKKSGYYVDDENWIGLCMGATIVEKDNQMLLRLIAPEDLDNEMVRCIDCSLQEDGWYIEDVQVVAQYYTKDMERELLKNNFVWD